MCCLHAIYGLKSGRCHAVSAPIPHVAFGHAYCEKVSVATRRLQVCRNNKMTSWSNTCATACRSCVSPNSWNSSARLPLHQSPHAQGLSRIGSLVPNDFQRTCDAMDLCRKSTAPLSNAPQFMHNQLHDRHVWRKLLAAPTRFTFGSLLLTSRLVTGGGVFSKALTPRASLVVTLFAPLCVNQP